MSLSNEILVECPKCGGVHFVVNEKYVQAWEAQWQHDFETKPKEWLASYGITDAPPTRENYLKCFRCGNKETSEFFLTSKELDGHTIQPILWEQK